MMAASLPVRPAVSMPLSDTVLVLAGLLTVALIAAGLCRNLPVPYTVVLVVIGMLLGEMAQAFAPLAFLGEVTLRPDAVFFLFLPALIFESGYNLDARQLVRDLAPVLVLAIPALAISTAIIGCGLWLILRLDLPIALLFGALISATDPVAVVALFRELGAPARLTVLVEGESLLNDATAIVAVSILLGIVAGGEGLTWLGAGGAVLEFFVVFLGGVCAGAVLGLVASEIIYRTRADLPAILTMSIALAYAAFTIAEHVLHVSGVMAAATAAVMLAAVGVSRMPQEAAESVGETWELVAFICNSLLFVLVGLSIDPLALASRAVPVAIAVLLVLLARALTVWSLVPLTASLFSLPRVAAGERAIMWWGGLKGGLAIAIVLSLPEDMPFRGLLLDLTLGVVLFTLLVNAPTIRPLMHWIGLDRLDDDAQAELGGALVEVRGDAERMLSRIERAGIVSKAALGPVRAALARTFESDMPSVGESQRLRHARLVTLRSELAELGRMRDFGLVSQYNYLDLRGALRRATEAGGWQDVPPDDADADEFFRRMENELLHWLREADRAAPLLATYQNVRLAQHLERHAAVVLAARAVVAALPERDDLDAAQKADIQATYERRARDERAQLRELRVQFPEFYRRFEAALASRVALRRAAQSAAHRYQQGEIGAKAYARIERLVARELAALAPISAAPARLSAGELIELVPLLSGMSEESLRSLAAHAREVTALPGDVLIGEGEHGDALYVVERGELVASRAGEDGERQELGRLIDGDFFGEMALLGDNVRSATVEAVTPSTLLRIARRDVLALAEERPEVRERLESASAARRSPD